MSDYGAYDMVGNLAEWVADWVPRSTGVSGSWSSSPDTQALTGAATSGEPGALIRGGFFVGGGAGPFFVVGATSPSSPSDPAVGFRCVRDAF